jgi:hypothetical protein
MSNYLDMLFFSAMLLLICVFGGCASTQPADYEIACRAEQPAREIERAARIRRDAASIRRNIAIREQHPLPDSSQELAYSRNLLRLLENPTEEETAQRLADQQDLCVHLRVAGAERRNDRALLAGLAVGLGAASDALWINNIQTAPLQTIAPLRRDSLLDAR